MPPLKETKLNELEPFPGYKGKAIHSKNMTVVFWDIEAGKPFNKHSHPNEQITVMIEGEIEMTIDNVTKILKAKDMAIIPENTIHFGKAITNCKVVDVFYPVREDYKV